MSKPPSMEMKVGSANRDRKARSSRDGRASAEAGSARTTDRPPVENAMDRRARVAVLIVAMVLVTAAVLAADFAFGAIAGSR